MKYNTQHILLTYAIDQNFYFYRNKQNSFKRKITQPLLAFVNFKHKNIEKIIYIFHVHKVETSGAI